MSNAIGLKSLLNADGSIEMPTTGPGVRQPVCVIFTSLSCTLKALERAAQLANPLQSGIEIVAVESVPFALPLDEPPVPFGFLVRRLQEMAAKFPEQIKVSAYLCRDQMAALNRVLNRSFPVVIGIRKAWWLSREERLARKLRHAGYNLILVEAE